MHLHQENRYVDTTDVNAMREAANMEGDDDFDLDEPVEHLVRT